MFCFNCFRIVLYNFVFFRSIYKNSSYDFCHKLIDLKGYCFCFLNYSTLFSLHVKISSAQKPVVCHVRTNQGSLREGAVAERLRESAER